MPAKKIAAQTVARTRPTSAAARKPSAAQKVAQPSEATPTTPASLTSLTIAKPAAAPAALASAGKPAKAPKPPKLRVKPVRDSFTMPEADFALIATLKARTLGARRETKKSELLRAGLHALVGLDTPALVAALGQLDPVKIGRPKKGH